MSFLPLFVISLIACLLCADTSSGLSFQCLTASVTVALVVSGPTAFLPCWLRRPVQFVLGELLIGLCLVDCYCQEYFSAPITPQLLSNVLLSDGRESLEFLRMFVGTHVLLHWRIVGLLFFALVLPLALLWQFELNMRRRLIGIVGGVLLALCIAVEVPAHYKFVQLFTQQQNTQNVEGLIFRHYHETASTPLHRLAFAWHTVKMSANVIEEIKRTTLEALPDSCSHLSPHIVLVIGESYNKHHSSLYGYQLPTTPRQQSRKDAGELFVFTDAVTPWNITSNAFLSLFSLWEHGMDGPVSQRPLFPVLFRRADYEVSFFSNQFTLKGFQKGDTNQTGYFFLSDKELSDSLFAFRNEKSSKYDLTLVEKLQDYRKTHHEQPYTLDIVHLIGQHFDYSERYPTECTLFTQASYHDRAVDGKAKKVIMHYDNATRYNDMVVDSILSVYQEENAVVIYVSDHGEEVYDELPVSGRLYQEPTAEQARQEFEVPMWIWCSPTYQQQRPEIIKSIRHAVGQPFMTDGMPQLLFSLAGLSTQWNDERRNVLSPSYQCKPRIIAGSIDYDALLGRRTTRF